VRGCEGEVVEEGEWHCGWHRREDLDDVVGERGGGVAAFFDGGRAGRLPMFAGLEEAALVFEVVRVVEAVGRAPSTCHFPVRAKRYPRAHPNSLGRRDGSSRVVPVAAAKFRLSGEVASNLLGAAGHEGGAGTKESGGVVELVNLDSSGGEGIEMRGGNCCCSIRGRITEIIGEMRRMLGRLRGVLAKSREGNGCEQE
jgi:hypothetical protein